MLAPDDRPGLRVERRGPVAIITLDRPERRNAIDVPDRVHLIETWTRLVHDASCRAIVLEGAGTVFCAGGDIGSMDAPADVLAERLDLAGQLARLVAASRVPCVAAVQGGAFGLGLSLAAACDVLIAANDAVFVSSFGKIGLVADTGLPHALARRVGISRAKEIILTSRTVRADEALQIGLADRTVPLADLRENAIAAAQQLADASSPMVAATRATFADPDFSLDGVLARERSDQLTLLAGPDFREGRLAFAERRAPRFTAAAPTAAAWTAATRAPASAPTHQLTRHQGGPDNHDRHPTDTTQEVGR